MNRTGRVKSGSGRDLFHEMIALTLITSISLTSQTCLNTSCKITAQSCSFPL